MWQIKLKAFLLLTAAILHLAMGAFVYCKNRSSKLNIYLGLLAFFSAVLAFATSYDYFRIFPYNSPANIPVDAVYDSMWSKMTYIGGYVLASWYILISHLKSPQMNRIRILGYFFCILSGIMLWLALFTPLIIKGTTFEYPTLKGIPGSLYILSRFYFVVPLFIGLVILLRLYRQSAGLKKIQMKYVSLGMVIYAGAALFFAGLLPLAGVREFVEVPSFLSLFFVGFTGYAIIRYRFLEIETIIHKTLLWLATSVLVFIPVVILFSFTYSWLSQIGYLKFSLVIMTLFYVYLFYYHKVQPLVNQWFRRKQYDYQQMLLRIGEKLTLEIDVEVATQTLLQEVTGLMYLRNGVLYLKSKEKSGYNYEGSLGYQGGIETALPQEQELKSIRLEDNYSLVLDFMKEKLEVLERQQILFDPQYEHIKEKGEELFNQLGVEVLVPLKIENNMLGIMGLGKKENLKAFTLKDIEVLNKLGKEAGISLHNALHHKDIVEKERLAEEMKLGREIQMALLPQTTPEIKGLNVYGIMEPAKEIGGDYYDYIEYTEISSAIPRKRFAVVIGDVCGKGVSAGLVMGIAKAVIYTVGEEVESPREILSRTNKLLYKYIGGQRFMSMLYMQWDEVNKKLKYSSAGHEHILVYRAAEKKTESILSGGIALGMMEKIDEMLEDNYLFLNAHDKVFLYTDGATEAHNEKDELFSLSRLQESITNHGEKPVKELIAAVKEEVHQFMGSAEQYDDITLVVLEVA